MTPAERRLVDEARSERALLGVAVAGGVAGGAILIPQAWLLAGMVSDAFLGHASARALVGPALLVIAAFAVRGGLSTIADTTGRIAARRVRSRLRRRAVEAVIDARPSALAGTQSGELVTTLTRGVEALDSYFAAYLPQLGTAVAVPLLVVAWTVPRDPVAAAILALTVPLVPLFMALIGLATRERSERRWRSMAVLGAYFLDLVRGLPTLRAFGRGPDKVEDIRRVSDQHRRATMRALQNAFLSSLVLELAAAVSTAMVAVAIGLRLDIGQLDLRTGLAVLMLAPEVYLPLRRLGAQFHAAIDAVAPAERLAGLAATLAAPAGGRGTADLRRARLELRGVSFARPDRGSVLLDAHLVVEAGERVALVGVSGAGKTTVLSLLLGYEAPDRGTVLAGGNDLRDLDGCRHRSQVAWLPARPALVAGTVADNLLLAQPDAPPAHVQAAAAALGVDDLIDRRVGDGGRALSAGQRQRVGLARLLLSDAPVVLLDEPTAHLDADSERAVIRLLEQWRGRTVVVATHSARLAQACDRVIELRGGRLQPVPEEVLA